MWLRRVFHRPDLINCVSKPWSSPFSKSPSCRSGYGVTLLNLTQGSMQHCSPWCPCHVCARGCGEDWICRCQYCHKFTASQSKPFLKMVLGLCAHCEGSKECGQFFCVPPSRSIKEHLAHTRLFPAPQLSPILARCCLFLPYLPFSPFLLFMLQILLSREKILL